MKENNLGTEISYLRSARITNSKFNTDSMPYVSLNVLISLEQLDCFLVSTSVSFVLWGLHRTKTLE